MFKTFIRQASNIFRVQSVNRNVSIVSQGKRGLKGETGEQGSQGEQGDPATNLINSVNGETGDVVLATDDISDSGQTNKYVTAAEKTKLGNLSGSNTGDQDLSSLVPKTTTVNGHALSANVTVSKSDVGLSNVDNTADTSKPVSTAQAAAIAVVQGDVDTHEADTANPHSVTKTQVGLGNADNTSDASKPVSSAQQTALDLKIPTSYLDTDGTLAGNSDSKIATQKAVKTYADALIGANDALQYKGVIDASSNPNYPAASAGHLYKISVAGKIGGASGINVEVGDSILCLVDNSAAGTNAAVGANWNIIQVNLDGAVIGPASVVDNGIARYDGTTGKLLQSSGVTINDNGDLVIADTKKILIGNSTASITNSGNRIRIDGATDDLELINIPEIFYDHATPTISMYNASDRTLFIKNDGGGAANLNVKSAIAAGGAVTGSNLSGTNTGDQNLSGYELLSNKATSTSLGTSDTLYPTQNAVKSYVDAVAQGLSVKGSVKLATAAALPANTYLLGVITITATGVLTVDGVAVALNDRILVKDEVSQLKNGVYVCTTAGAIGVAAVLTRSSDMDASAEFPGAFVFAEAGTVNSAAGFVCTNSSNPTVGTTAITFTQFSGAGEITAGTGISKSGNTLSVISRNIDGQAFDHSADITVIAPGTHAATGKTTPVDADELPLVDSAASNVLKKLTWANVKATLKTYFDTLYPPIIKLGVAKVSGGNSQYGVPGTFFINAGTLAMEINKDHYTPIFLPYAVTLTSVKFEVTVTPASASNMRIGIYAADADLQPTGAPLWDSGSVAIANGFTGVKTTAISSVPLPAGRYLVVVNCDVTFTLRTVNAANPIIDEVLGGSLLLKNVKVTRSYAAFPNPGTKWDTKSGSGGGLEHCAFFLWTE